MNAPFELTKEGKLKFLPDAIRLIPELAELSEREINAIIYAVDYHNSPARLKPAEERKMEAFKRFYRKQQLKDLELERFNRGAEAYHGLIFDIRREKIDAYKKKILQMDIEILHDTTSTNRIKEIDQASKYLSRQIDDLEKEYESDMEMIEMRKGKKMSFIEMWQLNIKRYNEYKGSISVIQS